MGGRMNGLPVISDLRRPWLKLRSSGARDAYDVGGAIGTPLAKTISGFAGTAGRRRRISKNYGRL